MPAKWSTRQKWLAAALALAGLGLAGFLLRPLVADRLEGRRICEQLRTDERLGGLFQFSDTTKEHPLEQLDAGTYQLTVTSDCYFARCTFVLPELKDGGRLNGVVGNDPCAGQQLKLEVWGWGRAWNYSGFVVPGALERHRMHVQVKRNGRLLWEGTPGRDCGKFGFCVDPLPP